MGNELTVPKTLREAIIHFADSKVCHDFMVAVRWPNGQVPCPKCGVVGARFMESVQRFKCYSCRAQFSIKVGTVLEDSALPLTKWLPAFWLLTSAKNGISSCELARSLGVTQKTAWFMLHRIRHILKTGTFEKLSGTVEIDETYVGGKEKNKHKDRRHGRGRGTVGKAIVMAALERGTDEAKASRVKTRIIGTTDRTTMETLVTETVETGSAVYTDAHGSYRKLSELDYIHEFVDHTIEYARKGVSTNGLENFFSLLKRSLKGTYVAVQPFHLDRYTDEQTFRYNTRKATDAERFVAVVSLIAGKRLTYDQLLDAYAVYADMLAM